MLESGNLKFDNMVQEYSQRLFTQLSRALVPGPLTYGFEYEFMPTRKITRTQVKELERALPGLGFQRHGDGTFKALNGLHITFEPGGQLEYGSPPLFAHDEEGFDSLLDHIAVTNKAIKELYGVKYQALDYCPDRDLAPLCLTGQRYRDMHALFSENGGRGLEMMKGTASIHLHVRIRSLAEIVPLFRLLQKLSKDPDFAMSKTRRAIWDKTESSRCRLPELGAVENEKELLLYLVKHAMQAIDFAQRVPFAELKKHSYDNFLVHLTTIFTDVRLNLKGPTLELRTMDSIPAADFRKRWQRFVAEVEKTV
ncbi:MAG: hypothetical protein J7M09_04060 [Deltaproteobacteria bacterium]|nr:hypothetical protein [Candidatus Tharpella sp.]